MKIQLKLAILSLLAVTCCISTYAHDFAVKNVDGVTIYYNKIPGKTYNCEVTHKGKYAEKKCYFGDIVIPATVNYKGKVYSVKGIGDRSFYNCDSVTKIRIPEGVQYVKYCAFEGCSSLTSINIPEGVTSIENSAFSKCSSLTSITIPDGVTSIERFTFYKCNSLKSIIIPDGVTRIGEYAFCECRSLTSITIPDGVTSIENSAFSDCSSLTSITIPDGVGRISEMAFYYCSSFTSITIPDGVRGIEKEAFCGCGSLTSITIPRSVSEIKEGAFAGCSKLEQVIYAKGMSEKEVKRLYAWNRNAYSHHYITFDREKEDEKPVFDPNAFPIINMSDITFVDDGNKSIDGNETCWVKMKVSNTGKGAAVGCMAKAKVSGVTGVTAEYVKIPTIAPGQTKEVTIELKADMTVIDGSASISVSVEEPNGFGCDPTLLTVSTKAFEAPKVLIADYSVTGVQGSTLTKRVPFDLQVLLQNAAHGIADDVDVTITVPQNVFITEGEQNTHFAKLNGGETQSMVYSLIVNNNYTGSTIPVQFTLKEKHGKYAENRTINLSLNQSLARNKIEIQSENRARQDDISIAKIDGASKQADIDIDIPISSDKNGKTFAVVIANENYKRESAVQFASNDGRMMQQYLVKTLGLPESNVHVAVDATLNEMRDELSWLKQLSEAYNGDLNIIFYYAGHGMPDETSGKAYLIPVDGNGQRTGSCLALSDVYGHLKDLKAKRVNVFLDACFSGSQRGDGMLVAARGVAIKSKTEELAGNLVVFSAAQGDETAYPYTEMGHGLFTYFLLKKLQETKGNVTLGELDKYITTEVRQRSIVVNRKQQTPTTSSSSALNEEWKNWKLK